MGNGLGNSFARERRWKCGFTLVELLVVIGIISLLTGILLPSLSTAKELARQSVCMVHLRGASKGMMLYATEHAMWLPGPNTSGAELSKSSSTTPVGSGDTDPSEPIANVDWASPALGNSLGLPRDKQERLTAIFNTELRCPSNDEFYDYQFPWASFSDEAIQSFSHCSYAATLAFHLLPGNGDIQVPQNGYDFIGTAGDVEVENYLQRPDGYLPHLTRMGESLSGKAMFIEGTRAVASDGLISFDARQRAWKGGNFMLLGPPTPHEKDPFYREENARKYGYRHNNETMNVALFDGHVESVNMNSDEALDMNRYFPSGWVIKNAGETLDPNDSDGDIIR